MPAARAFALRLIAALAGLASLSPAPAQEPFPAARPVEFVVLFPAGSSADVTARVLAEGMSRQLGTQIVVVNRPGGGGAIGYKYAAQQAPDGHHLVWNSNSISTTYHTGMLPFDYKSFVPVARVQVETPLLFVRGEAPWKSLREFLQQAKASPGKLTVGNSGVGSHTHLSSVWLFRAAGYQVTDVPFGAAQVVPSLLGGHVDAVLQLPAALAAPVKQGQVRLLAALIPQRDPALAGVPTAVEQGIPVSLEAWRGIAVPRGTPPATIALLERAIRATVESEEFARGAENLGVRPAYMAAAQFGEMIAKEDAETARIMERIGLKK
jgi:tripartite-type tricarboxylate transporter receptor subunit TctC